MKYYFLLALVFVISISCLNDKQKTTQTTESPKALSGLNTLFKQGDDGYACYRIPTVVTTNSGTVLAFCEARKSGCSDTGNIDLVMKRSTDNGVTWSALKVVWDDGANVCGNPVPVVDVETGAIHLLASWNHGEDHESEIINGTSTNGRMVYQLTSVDDGETWTTPKDITASVKRPHWTWYATGPVHGIQLKTGAYKGRLVIPCDHIEKDSKKYFSHVFYSDDHGVTWELGDRTLVDEVNECTVVELSSGDLMLNMRNYNREAHKARQIAVSKDGGATWENQQFDTKLPEPRCQGALLRVEKNNKNILLFLNPADANERVNMTLSISHDDGLSWNKKISIYESHSAYSDLTVLNNGDIFLLYEAGIENPYEGIHYKIISKNAL